MSLSALLTASTRPLFIVGQEKNAGKTVTLNRLRADANSDGLSGFGICTVGWDGETSDHLTGAQKPPVYAYEGDIVLTAAAVLEQAAARFEILWASSLNGRMGRLLIGRCRRSGEVQLVGTQSVPMLSRVIGRMRELGVRYILVDGAADRRTPISAVEGARVGLIFRPQLRENVDLFTRRIAETVQLYRLPVSDSPRPQGLAGEALALFMDGRWTFAEPDDLEQINERGKRVSRVWVGGPLTASLMDALRRASVKHVIVDDPSRLFVSAERLRGLRAAGLRIELGVRPQIAFVALRCDGGRLRTLAPERTLARVSRKLQGIPCFDAWVSRDAIGGWF